MAELVRVAVDAMGGDNAPTEIIKGVVEAVHADERVKVFLVGQEDVVKKGTRSLFLSGRADRSRTRFRSDRDGRASGQCDPR